MENKKTIRNLLLYLGIPIVLIIVIALIFALQPKEEYPTSDIIHLFRDKQVTEYSLDFGNGELNIKLNTEYKGKKEIKTTVASVAVFLNAVEDYIKEYEDEYKAAYDEQLNRILAEKSQKKTIEITAAERNSAAAADKEAAAKKAEEAVGHGDSLYNQKQAQDNSWWMNLLPNAILIILLVIVWVFFMRRLSGGLGDAGKQIGFGKAKIKKDKDTEPYEFRIIPEGYNWVESDQAEFIERLLPLSMHYQLVEDEAMYTRFAQLYDTAPTTSLESLLGLSMSKEKIQTLRYSRHLACLIRMTTGETLYFRIHGLSVRHKSGKTYNLSIEDPEGTKYKILANSDQDSYPFENVGDFKIIDLISNESSKSKV